MKPFAKRAIAALTLCLLVPALAMAQALRQDIDRIVALVEEDVILQSELDSAIDTILMQVQGRENLPPRRVIEEQVLERLIMTRLEVIRAEESGIRASDANVDQALQSVARQNGLTVTQLRQAIEADGLDFQEFRRQIREEILSSELRQRVAASMDDITETEVDILLASGGIGGPEYHLSQIMIMVPEAASAAEVQAARERIDEVRGRIVNDGLEFATAAITFSQAPDALEGGDVGWRAISTLPPLFADALRPLGPGEVTEPIRSPGGFLILRVNNVRENSEVIVQEFRARHLMIEPSELLTMQAAERRLRDLHARIVDGEDFSDLARRYSTDETSANIGGLLNWFQAGDYGPDMQRVIESLDVGELSEPFRTSSAWHIVRLEDSRQADRTREAMRAQAREMIFQQKAEDEIERFLRQLRAESFVEIRL